MRLHRLDAAVLELAPGADAFLKAYTTQTPEAARGAFLDAKGKAVAVYDHVRLDSDRSVLIVASAVVDRLRRHLKNYLFLTGSDFKPLPHAAYGGPREDAESARGKDDWIVPRGSGAVLLTTRSVDTASNGDAFRLFRWSAGTSWAMQGVDYDDPMLLNLADADLVSFTKGCYLGQEIMARVHYRGKPPLRLTAVTEEACPAELRERMTSRVADPATGSFKGFVFLPAD